MTHRNQQELATQAAAEPCRGGALPRRLLTGSCPPPARPRPASRENVGTHSPGEGPRSRSEHDFF